MIWLAFLPIIFNSDTFCINGQLSSHGHAPERPAQISLFLKDSLVDLFQSDIEGYFNSCNIPAGRYRLEVYSPGHEIIVMEELIVTSNSSPKLLIELPTQPKVSTRDKGDHKLDKVLDIADRVICVVTNVFSLINKDKSDKTD